MFSHLDYCPWFERCPAEQKLNVAIFVLRKAVCQARASFQEGWQAPFRLVSFLGERGSMSGVERGACCRTGKEGKTGSTPCPMKTWKEPNDWKQGRCKTACGAREKTELVKGRSVIAIPQNSFGRKQFKAEGNLVFWESLAMEGSRETLRACPTQFLTESYYLFSKQPTLSKKGDGKWDV